MCLFESAIINLNPMCLFERAIINSNLICFISFMFELTTAWFIAILKGVLKLVIGLQFVHVCCIFSLF